MLMTTNNKKVANTYEALLQCSPWVRLRTPRDSTRKEIWPSPLQRWEGEAERVKSPAQEYKAWRWQSWDLNPSSPAAQPVHLITSHSTCTPRCHQILESRHLFKAGLSWSWLWVEKKIDFLAKDVTRGYKPFLYSYLCSQEVCGVALNEVRNSDQGHTQTAVWWLWGRGGRGGDR